MICAAEDIVEQSKPQSFRGYYITVAVLVVLIVGAILVPMFVPHQETAIAEAVLPDGTILLLKDVTYGTHHELELPPDPYASVPLIRSTRSEKFIKAQSATDTLVIWLTRLDPVTGRPLDLDWWGKSSVVDANGMVVLDSNYVFNERFNDRFGGHSSGSGMSTRPLSPMAPHRLAEADFIYFHTTLPNFRCDGETFELRIHNTKDQIVATFEVPWRGPKSFPEWTPQPFPQSQSAGDLTVRLDSISDFKLEKDEGQLELRGKPQFRITQDDRPAEWYLEKVRMQDPLGNTITFDDWSFCDLSLKEPAWKMIVTLYRNKDAPLLPTEVWHVGKIPIDAPNRSTKLNDSHSLSGVPLELISSNGSGVIKETWIGSKGGRSSHSTGGSVEIGEKYINFSLELESDGKDYSRTVECELPHLLWNDIKLGDLKQLRFQATDNLGRSVQGEFKECEGLLYWFYAPEEGATEIDFKLIITEGRQVEFLVAPPEVKTE